MLSRLNILIDWLIPRNAKSDFYSFRKARILSIIHILLFALTFLMWASSFYVDIGDEVSLPLSLGIITALIYIFKQWGNLNFSGNMLATAFALTLLPAVFETGGLYSDNLLWLLIVPLIALLVVNRISGFVWMGLLVLFTIYLFSLDVANPDVYRSQLGQFGADYFLVSYVCLFTIIIGIVLIFAKGHEDIIEMLKKKQEVLRKQKREIAEQALDLQRAQKKLQHSNKDLEEFAYAASHDLKEPLRMIGSYTSLMERRMEAQLDEDTKEFMFYIKGGVCRMETLLNDLLDYSRMSTKQPEFKKTNLNDILLIVLSNLMASMQDTNTAIFANDLPIIRSSSTEMVQLFQNILSNSIKFRRNDIEPQIEINHRKEKDYHLISIKDNGIGIPPEYQERVFGIFERLNGKEKFEGNGIGLATCKKIVDKMGGKIWVNSELGRGATFYFTIPTAA